MIAQLYGAPDGYVDSAGRVHKERQSADDKPIYEVELRPEDGLYPLPYLATQADGGAWEEEDRADPGARTSQELSCTGQIGSAR